MSEPISHHYVPQFYLRNFSTDENQVGIGLFIPDKGVFANTAIKNIAAKDYLYGADNEIEKELSKMEGVVAEIFKTWISVLLPPPIDSPAFNTLKHFILTQIFRTIKAGKELNEAMNEGYQAIRKLMHMENDPLPEGILVHKDPTLLSLVYTSDKLALMDFLSIKTVVNLTDTPFITSDHPVIRYNQWMEQKGYYLGATGIAVKGLQIFLPIHPRVMICLYDGTVYKCGQKDKNVVKIESENDILQLNSLQYLVSDKSLFFDSHIQERQLQELVNNNKGIKNRAKHTSTITEIGKTPAGNPNNVILNSFTDPHIQLNLSFFKILKKAKEINLLNNLPIPRHPSFEELRMKHKVMNPYFKTQ